MKKLLLFVLFTNIIFAKTLTEKECIDKTIKNHPDIKSYMLQIEKSKKSLKSAKSGNLPQINLQANYNLTQTYPVTAGNIFKTVDDDGWSAGVALKQKLWDFSKTKYMIEAYKKDEDISKLSLKEVKALLSYKVRSLYELMVVQKEAIKVRKQDLKTKKELYKQAQALYKQGLKTKADTSRFLTAIYVSKNSLENAKSLYEKAKNSLSLYMGESIDDDSSLEQDVLKKELKSQDNIENIIKNNYKLKIDTLNIEKNSLLHKSSKASKYGSLDLVASYNKIGSLSDDYDSKLLGITLNIPLYNGGRLSAEEQKAKIALEITKQKKISEILSLKDEIQGLIEDIKKYDTTIKAKKEELISSNQTKMVIEGRYKSGLATYTEVLDGETSVLNAKLGILEAYYSKSMAINRLRYLEGKIK